MPVSSLCGYLPLAFPTSFTIDATGGYPGGVLYSSLLYVTARPALYLRGPNGQQPTNTAPQPLLHWLRSVRASRAPYGLSGWRC